MIFVTVRPSLSDKALQKNRLERKVTAGLD